MAIVLSLVIATVYGKRFINFLRHHQIGETVRDLGLAGEQQKKGTPTMVASLSCLRSLFQHCCLPILIKYMCGLCCFVPFGWEPSVLDDYLKLKARKKAQEKGEKYLKKDSDGLAGVSKIIGQIGLGIIIGATLYFNSSVTVEKRSSNRAHQHWSRRTGGKRFQYYHKKYRRCGKEFCKVKHPSLPFPL